MCVFLFFSFRVQTLIHFIAYTGTEAVVNRKARNSSVIAEISEENVRGFFVLLYVSSSLLLPVLLMPWN